MKVHIVQKGDTLWKISRQYGISFEELKRVNAHLANPDYIVPGMKIFLPEKKETPGTKPIKGSGEGHKKTKEEKPIQQPVKKKEEKVKEPVKEELPVPKEPIPLPQAPQMPQMPQMPQVPQNQPLPQMPMHTIPIIGIPCGWLPIYDADCHHHAHMGQIPQPVPMPTPPSKPPVSTKPKPSLKPKPKPTLSPKPHAHMESPLHTEHHSTVKPNIPMKEHDRMDHIAPELLESPIQGGGLPPMPEMMPMPMPPMPQQPQYMQPQATPCGCHYQMMPQIQHSNYCHACYQPMPYPMIPMQGQNPNWHGSY